MMIATKTSWKCPECKQEFYEEVAFHICNGKVDREGSLVEVKWVCLDEHKKLFDFTKDLWAILYTSDISNKEFDKLTKKLREFERFFLKKKRVKGE